jgi:hypothetical protein
VRDAGQFPEFEMASESGSVFSTLAPRTARTRPRELPVGHSRNKLKHRETGRYSIEQDNDLAVSEPMLQKLVMNMLAVRGEHRASADQAADN